VTFLSEKIKLSSSSLEKLSSGILHNAFENGGHRDL